MDKFDIDDINRKLAISAAKHGFAATARKAYRPEPRVIFDAFAWRNEEVLNHTASYLDAELDRTGSMSVVMRFIEEARSKFASGEIPENHRGRMTRVT